MIDKLEKCILFRGIPQDKLLDIFSTLSYKIKDYEKGDLVVESNMECRSLLIVLDGSVKGEMEDFSGKTIKIEDIESPGVLAPAFLFGSNNRYPVNIVANNEVKILSISKEVFIELLMSNKYVLTNYLNSMSNRAQFLSNKIRFLSFQTIKGKIAHYLLQLAKKLHSDKVIMPVSQNELSEVFGVARPSLARAIRELNDDEVIISEGKQIQIKDRNKLIAFLKGQHLKRW